MNRVELNNVKVTGKGTQAIFFVHGYGCDQSMWRYLVPAFAEQYRVVLLDLAGCGNSVPAAYDSTKYSTLHGYAEDVVQISKELGLTKSILVGHSVSSMIAVLASNQEPELFEKLILVAPSPSYIDEGDYVGGFKREQIEGLLDAINVDFLGWARNMAPVIIGNADRPELGQELTNSFCRTRPGFAREFARVTFLSNHREDLSKVTIPSLILQCSQDLIAPESVGRYMHRAMAGGVLKILRATGHCPHVSSPEETIAAMLEFLRQTPAIAA